MDGHGDDGPKRSLRYADCGPGASLLSAKISRALGHERKTAQTASPELMRGLAQRHSTHERQGLLPAEDLWIKEPYGGKKMQLCD